MAPSEYLGLRLHNLECLYIFFVEADDEFKEHFVEFVSDLLGKNLMVKEIHGTHVTGDDLFYHFKVCCNIADSFLLA